MGLFDLFGAGSGKTIVNEKNRVEELRTPFNEWPNDAGFDASIEQREPVELVVRGRIPSHAAGILYRTGPGNHKVQNTPRGEYNISHWFDGFAHIYRFQLIPTPEGSCKVLYNSRRQVDALIEDVRKTGRLNSITFGQKRDPCETIFQKLKTVFSPLADLGPEGSNVGVTIRTNAPGFDAAPRSKETAEHIGPEFKNLVVLTDATVAKTLDPETLQPLGVTNQTKLHPDLTGPLSCAHAQSDPLTGDLYNFNLAFGRSSTYRVFRVAASTGKTEILATITGNDIKATYIHSFFLTEDYMVLALWPAQFAAGGVSILWERNIMDAISKFDPNAETKWLVVDRKHGKGLVAKFSSPAMFAFHTVNAYQEEVNGKTDIYCDVVEYSNLDIMHRLYYDNMMSTGKGVASFMEKDMRENVRPRLVRYHLTGISATKTTDGKDAGKAEIIMKIPGPLVGELPTINPKYSSRKARFLYSMADRGKSSFMDSIVKTDLETKQAVYWEHPNHTPGEAIFIPDPNSDAEDAGVLLSVILDGDKGSSYLICLDGHTMKELGRAECDVAVGLGFHGRHIPYNAGKV